MPYLFIASAISQTIKLFIDKAKISPKHTKVIFIADAAESYKLNGEKTPWIDTDRQAFLKEGFEVIEMSLEELSSGTPVVPFSAVPFPVVEANFNSPFGGEPDKILKQVQDDTKNSGNTAKVSFRGNREILSESEEQISHFVRNDKNSSSKIILHICGGHTLYLLDKIRKCNLVATIQNLVLTDQVIYSGSSAGSMIVAPDLSVKKDLNDEPETWAKYLSDFTDYSGLNLVDFLVVPHFNIPEYSPYNQECVKNSSFNTSLLFLSDNQAVWVEGRKFEIVTGK